jgi:hypothetical protein
MACIPFLTTTVRSPGLRRSGLLACLLAGVVVLAGVGVGRAAEPAVTVLADFEDATVAASIGAVENVLRGDCSAALASIPARGRGSLALEIGATERGAAVVCDLTSRVPTRFDQAREVISFVWITQGEVEVAFRLIDAAGQCFETRPVTVELHNRWVRVAADLSPDALRKVDARGELVYPIELKGYHVRLAGVGTQTVNFDDLQVAHQVAPSELIQGGFRFNEPTRVYEPGSVVRAAVVLENRSRERALDMSVDLAWTRPDGSVLQRQNARVSLPAGGVDYRAYQELDFSQVIFEPGLYRLVAQARSAGWASPNKFATNIAVTPSNRRLSRGRSTFFAIESNLLREPILDQRLEISVARDIGVNLLALQVPWQQLEPKSGVVQFDLLAPVLDAIVERDMAALVVVQGTPEWLGDRRPRATALATLFDVLSARFGQRLRRLQFDAAASGADDVAAQLRIARDVQQRLAEGHPKLLVFPPPVAVADPAGVAATRAHLADDAAAPLMFDLAGPFAEAVARAEDFRRAAQVEWRDNHYWRYTPPPLISTGAFDDAEAVLQHYLRAAAAGVGGLVWFDLRDDDTDPENTAAFHGLVRRDFSPKANLLGYATAAGLLTGMRYAGPLENAPAEFESGLFIGGDQQVAVLAPRPNRVLPAVLMPVRGARGSFEVQDFERRTRPLLESGAPALFATLPRPLFLTLNLEKTNADPMLALARPWLRVPRSVFAGGDTEFALELDALGDLRRSYLQLALPDNAPVETSLTARGLRARAGETIREEITVTPSSPPAEFDEVPLTLRLSLEGSSLDVPLLVRSLTAVPPRGGRDITADELRLARLRPDAKLRATADGELHLAYDNDTLYLAVRIEDDRRIATEVDAVGQSSGDELLVGVALERATDHAEVRLDPAAEDPQLVTLDGTPAEQIRGWQVETRSAKARDNRWYIFRIPVASLGGGVLRAGQRLLVAVRYVDDDQDGFSAVPIQWGHGLDGSYSASRFRWIELVE